MKLDPEVLAQVEEVGGRELLEQLFELYLEHAPGRLRRIGDALAAGDASDAAKALHSLRSSSATLGAGDLAADLGDLEEIALTGDAVEVAQRWPAVERRTEEVLAMLRRRKMEREGERT